MFLTQVNTPPCMTVYVVYVIPLCMYLPSSGKRWGGWVEEKRGGVYGEVRRSVRLINL